MNLAHEKYIRSRRIFLTTKCMNEILQYFKKGKYKVLSLFILICLCKVSSAQEQQVSVFGVVKDSIGGIPGVYVKAQGGNQTAVTDVSGRYKISVNKNAVLLFTSIGYTEKKIQIGQLSASNGEIKLDVEMLVSEASLEEVTVVGFGTQRKANLVSSVTSVNVKDLKGPTGNMTNSLAGKVSGLIAFQQSGEPGNGTDNSTFYIRGLSTFGSGKQNPLILIDGIESSATDMARLQPDDISDFSVLKDAAAAAVYGARGANGVVLINTKSGESGKTVFSFRAENRMSTNTNNFKMADNITYMNDANEAALTRNPLAVTPYSQNKINHTVLGDDPYLYPNNDWIDMLIKDYTMNQSYNLNVNGGNQKARYYIAGTYNQDNGVLKVDPINNFNSNIKLANYSIRTNVNFNVTNTTEVIVRMYGQFDDYTGPIAGGTGTFNNAMWSNPVMFPSRYPQSMLPYIEHPLFGSAPTVDSDGLQTSTLFVNPYAEMVKGYKVYKTSNIQPQFELKQDFGFITKGLSARAMTYLKRYAYYGVSRNYNPFYYNAIINPTDQSYELSALNHGSTGSIGTVGTEFLGYNEDGKVVDSKMYLETAVNYNRTFAEKHNVGGMLITYLSSFETGNGGALMASLPQRNNGLSGRFSYGYDNRYLFEANFGYNGSERFHKTNRFGFFPSVGVAYRVSNEKYFTPLKNVITDLKIRGTYGLVGNDQIGNTNERFFYLSNANLNNGSFGASFGKNDGGSGVYNRPGVSIDRYPNEDITWELSKQTNIGLDLTLFNDFELIVDVFKQKRSQILMPTSNIGSSSGVFIIPSSNYGKGESQGLDLSTKYQKSFNKNFWANVRGTFTYATSKVTLTDEIKYDPSLAYLSRVGHSMSQAWGYVAERLFVDQEEVNNSPLQFNDSRLLAGDIKYRDINGDGLVNSDDMVPIGYPTQPEIIYGFGSSFGYKKFDFSFYFQGSARSSFFISPANIQPFFQNGGFQNGLLQTIHDSHWTEDNRDLYAFWPRLSTGRVESNNQVSTWWMRNGDFLRLKSVDMGYNIAPATLKRVGINSARIYLSATNLFLLSNFKLWDVEMGGNGLGYPVQSVYSLGLQVSL
jgi:TonB-linked SusC/RagA family outer membrane protein